MHHRVVRMVQRRSPEVDRLSPFFPRMNHALQRYMQGPYLLPNRLILWVLALSFNDVLCVHPRFVGENPEMGPGDTKGRFNTPGSTVLKNLKGYPPTFFGMF